MITTKHFNREILLNHHKKVSYKNQMTKDDIELLNMTTK